MAFYDRLKESRIKSGLTQEQLAEKLGIAKSTLSGYESGNREPAIATVAKMLDILNIDANYLYQDETQALTELIVSLDEKSLLKKYRSLDEHGKEMVDFTLTKEWERSLSIQKTENIINISNRTELAAAHARTDITPTLEGQAHDNAIMDDDSEWE